MTNESEDDLVDGLVKDTLERLELQCADRSLIGHVLGTAMLRHIERELGDADDERCAAFAIAYFFGGYEPDAIEDILDTARVHAWDTDSFITRRGLRVIDGGSDPRCPHCSSTEHDAGSCPHKPKVKRGTAEFPMNPGEPRLEPASFNGIEFPAEPVEMKGH